jgi:hypothetical protein
MFGSSRSMSLVIVLAAVGHQSGTGVLCTTKVVAPETLTRFCIVAAAVAIAFAVP